MSAFRPIAPALQYGESTSSSSISNGPGDASSGGNSTSTGGSGSSDSQRKRRAQGNVSLMACKECRHARARCDGTKGDPCSRCIGRNIECLYEPHARTNKDELFREIENLRGANAELLSQNSDLLESNKNLQQNTEELRDESDWMRAILDTVGQDGHDKEIIKRLRAGDSYKAIGDWLIQIRAISAHIETVPPSQRSLIAVIKRVEEHYQADDEQSSSVNELVPPDNSWTTVTTSTSLLRHLFDLYFTWVHPVHMLMSMEDFKDCFKTYNSAYCSSALVNAMCAQACHLLTNNGVDVWRRNVDAGRLREAFLKEARNSLTPDIYTHITSVQAFALIYLVELSDGHARRAQGYLRTAVEHLRMVDTNQSSPQSLEITKWGIYCLNIFWAGMVYQKPENLDLLHTPVFQDIVMRPESPWCFYRQIGDEGTLPKRNSHALLTARSQAHLFGNILESIYLFCGAKGKVHARDFLKCYKRYTTWLENLPPEIKSVDVNAQPLPHVLFLHIQYHTAMILHLCPLIHCGFFAETEVEEVRQLVVHHALTGWDLMEHSRRLYTARYAMPLGAFCILRFGDALLRYAPESNRPRDIVISVLSVLQEAHSGFPVCGPLQGMFRSIALECQATIPPDVETIMGHTQYGIDDILDACMHLKYTEPFDQIKQFIHPLIASEWRSEWQKVVVEPELDDPNLPMRISSLLSN